MKKKVLFCVGCIYCLFTVNLAQARWPQQDPHSEKYYPHSPYSYAANNPIRYVDPDGRDWYSYNEEYEDEQGNMQNRTRYAYTTEYRSQKDLDRAGIKGSYIGLNKTVDGTYLSLFGQEFGTASREERQIARMAENLDETIKNSYRENIIDHGFGIMEEISYSRDMSVPGTTPGRTTVFQYGEGTVRYNAATNMSGGEFSWSSGKFSQLGGYMGPKILGVHARVYRNNANFDVLHWSFPDIQSYNATRQKSDILFNGRPGYRK